MECVIGLCIEVLCLPLHLCSRHYLHPSSVQHATLDADARSHDEADAATPDMITPTNPDAGMGQSEDDRTPSESEAMQMIDEFDMTDFNDAEQDAAIDEAIRFLDSPGERSDRNEDDLQAEMSGTVPVPEDEGLKAIDSIMMEDHVGDMIAVKDMDVILHDGRLGLFYELLQD